MQIVYIYKSVNWPIILRVALYSHKLQDGAWMIFITSWKNYELSNHVHELLKLFFRQTLQITRSASYFKFNSSVYLDN